MTARHYPALDLIWASPVTDDDSDVALAVVDDFDPTAVETRDHGIRVFFPTATLRDEALSAVRTALPHVTSTALSVPDDNWAERSQASLTSIRVGRIIVAPPWALDTAPAAAPIVRPAVTPERPPRDDGPLVRIVIQPSMGFGTGHHASTRLCLALLQAHSPPAGLDVLDVGTGSGVLAIAAHRLSGASALGIDVDPDAIVAATENVELNRATENVRLEVVDMTREAVRFTSRFGLTFANLTGALLCRLAPALVSTLAPRGLLITSGFQTDEHQTVAAALSNAGAREIDYATEDGWVAGAFVESTLEV